MPDNETRPSPRLSLPPTAEHEPLQPARKVRVRAAPAALLMVAGLVMGVAVGFVVMAVVLSNVPREEGAPIVAAPLTLMATVPPAIVPTPQPPIYPYISGITDTSHQIYQTGLALGNRPDVFSKVGDSITVAPQFLTPIGWGDYHLGEHTDLAPVVEYYSQAVARDGNSFTNNSLAAEGGWSAWTVLNPGAASDWCFDGEQPLVCEYRIVQPSVALIMLGTNDAPYTDLAQYEVWMREIIETSISMGVIPVVSTIPEFHWEGMEGRVARVNEIIVALATEYDVPLWDYHAALAGVANEGISSDGVHPSGSWTGPGTDLTPENLAQYGMTVRNLTALQALDAIWRGVIQMG
jgi:hypothetical protein